MAKTPITSTTSSYLETITFQNFFEFWTVEQSQHLENLISASNNYKSYHPTQSTDLTSLINRVINHYVQYYDEKLKWIKHNALSMIFPSWLSPLEDAFLWIGGWRPSMAFHLLYSKSGLQLEAQLGDLIRGLTTGDLADLSPSQLTRFDDMQRRTINEEKVLTEKMAKQQETVADSSMVELSHVVSELIRSEEMIGGRRVEERVESSLKEKEERFGELMRKADKLRLRTLKEVVGILSPIQAVHFLIAAAELHLRLHQWGKERDSSLLQTN